MLEKFSAFYSDEYSANFEQGNDKVRLGLYQAPLTFDFEIDGRCTHHKSLYLGETLQLTEQGSTEQREGSY